MKNPHTRRLKELAGTRTEFRLLSADREFLRDLARVHLLSDDLASKHHYTHLKGGATRSLDRLEAAGLLEKKTLRVPGQAPVHTYQFANEAIARAWGGALPVTGAKRTDLHELISSRLYYELGRPQDFRLAADFTPGDITAVGGCRPDALYTDTDTGELVAVEADSGQYTRRQILEKMARWNAVGLSRQVWGQPTYASSRVPTLENVAVYRL